MKKITKQELSNAVSSCYLVEKYSGTLEEDNIEELIQTLADKGYEVISTIEVRKEIKFSNEPYFISLGDNTSTSGSWAAENYIRNDAERILRGDQQ